MYKEKNNMAINFESKMKNFTIKLKNLSSADILKIQNDVHAKVHNKLSLSMTIWFIIYGSFNFIVILQTDTTIKTKKFDDKEVSTKRKIQHDKRSETKRRKIETATLIPSTRMAAQTSSTSNLIQVL